MYAINFPTQSLSNIIHLFSSSFFLFLKFSSPYLKKKKKKKTPFVY